MTPVLLAALLITPRNLDAWTAPRSLKTMAFAKSKWQQNLEDMQKKRRFDEEAKRPPRPKSRYVPPEESNTTAVNILEEEKIRFDALRYGDQWKQNEILRKNLG